MKFLATAPLLFLLAPAPPDAQWQWQRILLPPPSAPMAIQCVVLDASLYEHAAPGLRDVRLIQDGRELPFATDISIDDRTGDSATPLPDDRALYETVLILPLGSGAERPLGQQPEPAKGAVARGLLPQHVPVERIRIDPAPERNTQLSLRAAPAQDLADAETLAAPVAPQHPSAAFTIGANLQDPADIVAGLRGDEDGHHRLILEMRRREICYQPLSMSPVRLLLGNPDADPVHYAFASQFKPSATPLLAVMGPLTKNPTYREPQAEQPAPAGRTRLALMIAGTTGLLALTLLPLLRLRR